MYPDVFIQVGKQNHISHIRLLKAQLGMDDCDDTDLTKDETTDSTLLCIYPYAALTMQIDWQHTYCVYISRISIIKDLQEMVNNIANSREVSAE